MHRHIDFWAETSFLISIDGPSPALEDELENLRCAQILTLLSLQKFCLILGGHWNQD